MKINDPSLWPDELGDLHFDFPTDDSDGGDVLVLNERGLMLGLLFWREDAPEGVELPISGGWELVMEGDDDEPLSRQVLVLAANEEIPTLTDDVIAWATLTILCRMAGRCPGQG